MKRTLGVAALAVLGIVIAAAVTLAANSLTSQDIGLSDEPVGVGQELAAPETTASPAPTRTARPKRRSPRRTPTATPVATSTPAPPVVVVPTDDGDDGGGKGRGRNRGRGGGDDD